MSPHTVRSLRLLVSAMILLAVGVIAALAIGLIAQSSAADAAKKAAAASDSRANDLQTELTRFKAFTGSVLCGIVQPISVVTPPPGISSLGITILHGSKDASDRLGCPAPKGR